MTTPQAVRCPEHPDVETYLRCAECETHICPRCMYQTPVGAKCKVHARLRKHPLYNASPLQLAKGGAAALGSGLGLGLVWGVALDTVGLLGFLSWFVYVGIGYAIGEATGKAANRKRGPVLQVFAVMGTHVAFAASSYFVYGSRLFLSSLLPFNNPILFLLLVVACLIASSRVR